MEYRDAFPHKLPWLVFAILASIEYAAWTDLISVFLLTQDTICAIPIGVILYLLCAVAASCWDFVCQSARAYEDSTSIVVARSSNGQERVMDIISGIFTFVIFLILGTLPVLSQLPSIWGVWVAIQVFLLAFSVVILPVGICIVHYRSSYLLPIWLLVYRLVLRPRIRWRRSHISNMRRRHYLRLVRMHSDPPPTIRDLCWRATSVILRITWSCMRWGLLALFWGYFGWPALVFSFVLPLVVFCWRSHRNRQPTPILHVQLPSKSRMRRANRRRGRRQRSGGGEGEKADPVEVSSDDESEEENASPASVSAIPDGLYERVVPSRDVLVKDALVRCPPVGKEGRPLVFSATVPVLSTQPPNYLVDPLESVPFAAQLEETIHDLLWASRHAPILRKQLAEAPDAQSIQSVQVSTTLRLPLWGIQFLVQLERANTVLQRWQEAISWLQESSTDGAELAPQCLATLDHIPWSSQAPGLGSRVVLLTRDLATVATKEWFTDEIMNTCIDFIIRRMAGAATPTTHAITNSYFLESLSNAFALTSQYRFRKHSPIDQGVRSKQISVLEVPVNIRDQHWAGLRIDLRTGEYCYRDSLHGLPPPGTIPLLERYFQSVSPDVAPLHQLKSAPFPSGTHQTARQRDGFSCGPAYISSLAEQYIEDPEWLPGHAREARMRWFLRLSAGYTSSTEPSPPTPPPTHPPSDSDSESDDDDSPTHLSVGPFIISELEDVPIIPADAPPVVPRRTIVSEDPVSSPASMNISLPPSSPCSSLPSLSMPSSRYSSLSRSPSPRPGKKRRHDDSSNDEDTDSDGSEVRRSKRTKRSGKSWEHAKALNEAAAQPDFEASVAKLATFRKKIRELDVHAEFDDKDLRRVRCSSCTMSVLMRVVYEINRFVEHRKTQKCKKMQKSGLSSISLSAFVKKPTIHTAPPPSRPNLPSIPCPGLQRSRYPGVDRYMSRSMAAGGGARNRLSLAQQLYGAYLTRDECRWPNLSDARKNAVLRLEKSLHTWRKVSHLRAVFSTKCTNISRTPPSLNTDERPLPCAECVDLLKNHLFQNAMRRRVPKDKDLKNTPQTYRDPELGGLYARIHGLQRLFDANQDRADRVFGQFAVGALDGTFDTYEAALGVVRAMVAHADRERQGKSLRNMQYTNALDTFAQVLSSISPAAYRVFRQNFPARSVSSLNALRAKQPRFAPGFASENIARIKEHLARLKYTGPLAFGWDDTDLEAAITVVQRSKELCLVLGPAGDPISVKGDDDVEKILKDLDPNTPLGTKLRAWLISIPLLGIPPTLVALVARKAEGNADELFAMHQRVIDLLHEHDIHPVSLSSDGTETERSLQRMIAASASAYKTYAIEVAIPNCTLVLKVPLIHGHPSIVAQDSKHCAKTFRNQILSGARYLVIGCYSLFYHQLLDLAASPFSRLFRRDVERVDKQDDRAAARTLSGEVLECLLKEHPERRALALYLFVAGEMIDAWQNRNISHTERIRMVTRARYFLMAWRAHVVEHPEHKLDVHFISRESFDISLIMCDSLLMLIHVYRDFYPQYPLLPWLHSTEMVEHFFGLLRKVKKDFTFADALYFEPKVRALMMGAFRGFTAEEKANIAAGGYFHTYFHAPDLDEEALKRWPTDSEVSKFTQLGLQDAIALLETVGIDARAMLDAYTPPPNDTVSSTWSPSEDPSAVVTLHDLMRRFQYTERSATAVEEQLDVMNIALAAESAEKTMDIKNLPDLTEDDESKLRERLNRGFSASDCMPEDVNDEPAPPVPKVKAADDLVERAQAPGQVSIRRLTLVGLRKAHQTRHAVRALRQVPILQPLSLTAGANMPGSTTAVPVQLNRNAAAEPSLRERLVQRVNQLTKPENVQPSTGMATSGVDRQVRKAGVAVNSAAGNSGRDHNKAVMQGVAAQDFQALRNRAFLQFQSIHESLLASGDISHDRPLKIGDYIAFLRPGTQKETPRVLFGQVEAMYTNSGKKGAAHDDTTEIASVGAPSYVDVQAFAPLSTGIYQSLACPELNATTHYQVPRTHVLVSLARDRPTASPTTISRQEIVVNNSRPLAFVTLGVWSSGVMEFLSKHVTELANVIASLMKLEKGERKEAKEDAAGERKETKEGENR